MSEFYLDDEWQRAMLHVAYKRSLGSPDPSTQNAALVFSRDGAVLGKAVNDFTKGMEVRPEMLERPLKYSYIEHAERNALYAALSDSIELYGRVPHIMVCPWAACADCARAIVQSGVKYLIRHEHEGSHWNDSITIGDEMMWAGGVTIITVEGKLGGPPVLRNGEVFHP